MTILCATDFSPSSEIAVDLAAALAQRQSAPLVLLHVLEPITSAVAAAVPEGILLATAWQRDAELAAGELLQRRASSLHARGLTVTTEVRLGSAAHAIRDVCRQNHANLIVMGTHGRKAAARLFLGSVAEEVVRSAPCPVLVTGGGQPELVRWGSDQPLRLALGFDGSAASEDALAFINRAATTWSPDVAVIRAYWPAEEAYRYGIEATVHEGDDRDLHLMRLLERDTRKALDLHPALRNSQVHLRPAHISADRVLVSEAERLGADVIVVGVGSGRPPAWNSLRPLAVLAAAHRPVLCVPATPSDAQEIPAIGSVLIATDLSDTSRQAVLTGYALLPTGGRVELCHVHERERAGGAPGDAPATEPLDDGRRQALEAQLRALIPAAARMPGTVTNINVIEGPATAESLLQAARRLDVDILVVGSHGRTGVGRVLLGSVAEQVARHSSRPVVIAHAHRPEPA